MITVETTERCLALVRRFDQRPDTDCWADTPHYDSSIPGSHALDYRDRLEIVGNSGLCEYHHAQIITGPVEHSKIEES